MKNFNVLVTSSAAKVPLLKSVKDAMDRFCPGAFLHCADINGEVASKYFADEFWNMPSLSALSLEKILGYCRSEGIRCIIPTRDGELGFWAALKDLLAAEGVHVMVSNPSAVEKSLDKFAFCLFAKKLGLPVIETTRNIDEIHGDRLVVKECFGAGSVSMGIDLSRQEAAAHSKSLNSPVFQPFISGREYSVDVYADKYGNVKGAVARERLKIENGESKITQKIDDADLERTASALASGLGLYGHAVMQIIRGEQGDLHIIECNCRFGGASTLSVACGLDSFYWFMLESAGEDLSSRPFVKAKKNLKMIRYQADLII